MRSRVVSSVLVGVVSGVLVALGWTSVVEAQDSDDLIRVTDVVIMEVGEEKSVVLYEALVMVGNAGDVDFVGTQRIDLQVDGGDRELVYVVSGLDAGGQKQFKFRFELEPGERIVGLLVGDVAHETRVSVSAADLSVRVNAQHVVRGGFVEFDVGVDNEGERVAREVELSGSWERIEDGEVGEVDFGLFAESIDVGGSAGKLVSFEVEPGTYRFELRATTASTEAALENNVLAVEREVEYVEFDVVVESSEVLRWHAEGRGLVAVTVGISNVGVNDSVQFLVGIECVEEECSGSEFARPVVAGGSTSVTLEVWVPVGSVMVTAYAGANDDGFRWGDGNVAGTTLDVPDSPPFEWTLSAVSDAQDLQYWSDGSANAVFETRLENLGSGMVSGEVQIVVSCLQDGEVIEECGGEYVVAVDGEDESSVTRHTFRVPSGETELHFSVGEEDVLRVEAVVPQRILGVDREVWECFSDTSNLRRHSSRDSGVGCGGWRNDFVVKWPVGEPVRVWTSGGDEYQSIFNQVLDDIGPLLNLEFMPVSAKSSAQLSAYLGLPRRDTRLENLNCNSVAGCAWFEIASDRTIHEAELVVWPPLTRHDQVSRRHLIYSIALHELIHVLTGMLHRHDDRTSVMSYDSLDYNTLGETDSELIRIASHRLVRPGMAFEEIGELLVFEDELVDPPVVDDVSVRAILRRAHARLMDDGSAIFEIKGGWPSCGSGFDWAEYQIGGIRPRTPRWVHFENKSVNYYMIRTPAPMSSLRYWFEVAGDWREVTVATVPRLTSFRDSFSNPLVLLSSINIYGEDLEMKVVSREGDLMTLEMLLNGGDVRVGWSKNKTVYVKMEVDTSEFKILNYEMYWTFDPYDLGVCGDYRVEARNVDYGSEFIFPEAIRSEAQ